jgi:hypothetical protein
MPFLIARTAELQDAFAKSTNGCQRREPKFPAAAMLTLRQKSCLLVITNNLGGK